MGYERRLKRLFFFLLMVSCVFALLAKSRVRRFADGPFEGRQTRGDLNDNSIVKCSFESTIRSIGAAYVLQT